MISSETKICYQLNVKSLANDVFALRKHFIAYSIISMQGAAHVAAVNMKKNNLLAKSFNISQPGTILVFKNDKYSPSTYEGIIWKKSSW